MPVTGFLSGDATVTPAILNFGVVATSDIVRSCSLKFNRPIDIEGIKLTTPHSFIKAEIAKATDCSDQWTMTVRASLPEKVSDKLIQGRIVGSNADGTIMFMVPYTGILNVKN